MSALVVDDAHIDVLIMAGLRGSDSDMTLELRWYFRREPFGPLIDHGLVDHNAFLVGEVLRAENVRSVQYRYGERAREALPNQPYVFTKRFPSRLVPTIVEILKAISCYEYQACETPDWEESEAYAFCQALRMRMIHELPGYDKAPWVWTDDMLTGKGARE